MKTLGYQIDSLPSNVEAERSILGAILLDAKAYDEAAASGITSADFSLDSNRRIYTRMVDLAESSRPVDMITLIEELDRHKDLQAIGDAAYVSSLVEGVPDRPSIKHYVNIVRDKAASRKLVHACNATPGMVGDGCSSQAAIEELGERILQIQTGSDAAPAQRVISFSDQAYTEWEQFADGSDELIGLSTGIKSIDDATTGIRKGEFWPDRRPNRRRVKRRSLCRLLGQAAVRKFQLAFSPSRWERATSCSGFGHRPDGSLSTGSAIRGTSTPRPASACSNSCAR